MKISSSFLNLLKLFFKKKSVRRRIDPKFLCTDQTYSLISAAEIPAGTTIGVIAGSGVFPILFAKEAKSRGYKVFAVCHENETEQEFFDLVDRAEWIRLGQLGSLISFFKDNGIKYVVFAGGISRIKHFGDVKLDARGAALILRLRSTKDDVIMRGISAELLAEGITVLPCTIFMSESICPYGNLTKSIPTEDENLDIEVGISAIKAISSEDIGQLVVVREGAVVAVEAIEGTNQTIKRGSELGGKGVVVVKFAKPTQDMRFDVPTIGISTIELLRDTGVRVLALEAGRSIILDRNKCINLADELGICIVGLKPLVAEILA